MSIKTVDVRLRSPFTAIVSGPTGSGKTRLLLDLIRQAASVATPPPVVIYYHYGEWQDAFGETSEVTFRRGPPDVEADIPNDGQNRWLIIDDLMEEALGKGKSNALYTKYSHHRNISVFFVTQNLFHKDLRTVSLNTHYFFLGKNPRDAGAITILAKQAFPGQTKYVVEAYRDATREPHSFLLVNLRQEAADETRLIGNFARGLMYAYVSKRG